MTDSNIEISPEIGTETEIKEPSQKKTRAKRVTTPKKIDTISSLQSIRNSMEAEADNFLAEIDVPPVIDTMSEENCEIVINKYATKNNCTPSQAAVAITLLVQNGGTNLSKKPITRVVNDKRFDLTDLREVIKEVDKNGTVRKFAKGIRDIIIEIALLNNWSGPLKNSLKINNPAVEITEELGPWCLEIHADNPECPQIIKEALIRREEQLKATQIKASLPNKPRNQRGKKKKR